MKRILHLTLIKEWFDLIAQGKKKTEYRELKDYWMGRLMYNDTGIKQFDEVHFRNGYSKDAPYMRVECLEICLGYSDYYDADCFKIELGKVLEIKNWHGELPLTSCPSPLAQSRG